MVLGGRLALQNVLRDIMTPPWGVGVECNRWAPMRKGGLCVALLRDGVQSDDDTMGGPGQAL